MSDDIKRKRAAFREAGYAPAPFEIPLTPGQQLGKLGGAARAKALTAEQRSEIGRKGAASRWHPGTWIATGKDAYGMPLMEVFNARPNCPSLYFWLGADAEWKTVTSIQASGA